MNPILKAAIDVICREREAAAYSAAFDAVEALHQAYGEEDLANRLYRKIPCSVPFEIVCELLNILAWDPPDNGAAVQRTLEGWLREGTDNRKLLIALHVEVFRSSMRERCTRYCPNWKRSRLRASPRAAGR